eukprot:791890-Prorocentrum_minimum.AAC.2
MSRPGSGQPDIVHPGNPKPENAGESIVLRGVLKATITDDTSCLAFTVILSKGLKMHPALTR